MEAAFCSLLHLFDTTLRSPTASQSRSRSFSPGLALPLQDQLGSKVPNMHTGSECSNFPIQSLPKTSLRHHSKSSEDIGACQITISIIPENDALCVVWLLTCCGCMAGY